MTDPGSTAPLEDFPLQGELGLGARRALPESVNPAASPVSSAAPLGPRLSAAAADAAAVLLLTALAILGARLSTGQSPRLAGLPWTLGFVVYLSLFATVPALVLFGRTVGMAISDLSAHAGAGPGVPAGAAFRRWSATLATAATGGLLLLWTRDRPETPTPADRLSGYPLSLD